MRPRPQVKTFSAVSDGSFPCKNPPAHAPIARGLLVHCSGRVGVAFDYMTADFAVSFRDAACWEWMASEDIFGVMDPKNGNIAYCCILGNMGEEFGLFAYLGDQGLQSLQAALSGRLLNHGPMFLDNALTCSFEDRNTLSTRDLALIKELGLTFRGRRKWPWLRYREIGYYPWYMDDEQASFMAQVLEQALDVALLCQEGRSVLDTPDGAIPVRVLAPSGSWEFRAVETKEPQITVTVPVLLDEFLQRYTLPSASADICEIDMFYLPSPIQETRGNGPYYPTACILLDSRGLICGMELIKDQVEEAAQCVNLLPDYIADQRRLPQEVRVSNLVAYLICQGACNQLGISLKRVKKLRWAPQARRELSRRF